MELDTAGKRIVVAGPTTEEQRAELQELWSHVRVPASGPEPGAPDGYRGLASPASSPVPEPLVVESVLSAGAGYAYDFSCQLTRAVIAGLIGEKLLLHAGAVDVEGFGLVAVTGPSGAGKSTAIRELSQYGSYVTDELLILDPDTFMAEPYPKPVSLIDLGGGKTDVPLADLSITPARGACGPLRALLVLDRHHEPEGCGRAEDEVEFTRLSLSEALPLLGEQTSSVESAGGLRTLAQLITGETAVLRVRYREASALASSIRGGSLQQWLEDVPVAEVWEWIEPLDEEHYRAFRFDAAVELADRPLSVRAGVEALLHENGLHVLAERQILSLSGAAAGVWVLLREEGPLSCRQLWFELRARRWAPDVELDEVAEVMAELERKRLVGSAAGCTVVRPAAEPTGE